MPRALRFFSYIPSVLEDEQSRSRTVTTDIEAPVNASLFSTFAIYQGHNQLHHTQASAPLSIEADHVSPETISGSSLPQQVVIPELDKAFIRLYTRFRNKYDL
jgi:hypothetical protein